MTVCNTEILSTTYDSTKDEAREPLLIEYSWQGVIKSISETEFTANIYDPLIDKYGELVQEISEVSKYNQKYIQEGSTFILLLYRDHLMRKQYKFEFIKYRPPSPTLLDFQEKYLK